jgi:hypothetical protein
VFFYVRSPDVPFILLSYLRKQVSIGFSKRSLKLVPEWFNRGWIPAGACPGMPEAGAGMTKRYSGMQKQAG